MNLHYLVCFTQQTFESKHLDFLSGKSEIVHSQFRHCTNVRGRQGVLPIWAWITIAVGCAILILAVAVGIVSYVSKSRKKSSKTKKFLPEPRQTAEKGRYR